ncbi:MAG: prolipoprotein diacylglyceryl transferase [Saprospiraceae bacterium]|nr:prolipoprotein diacylglyceryl transferase [Saprospiraceae bacterium]
MEDYLIVASNGPWYNLIYNLAFLITLCILLYEGYRRKFPLLKWIFIILITHLLFISGTKIGTYSANDFYFLFSRFQLPETSSKSLLGGLLFIGIGLMAVRYVFRFKHNILDAFAVAIPVGIAIQRIGCFVTGCCYGKICTLPWAVKYPVYTLPHFHQFNDKLISTHDLLSLPVHPVQLYEMAGLIVVVFLILKFRKTFKAAGSSLLLSMVLIFVVRFVSEFFRDVHAHTVGGEMVSVFNVTQLVLVPLILILSLMLWKKEKLAFNLFRIYRHLM